MSCHVMPCSSLDIILSNGRSLRRREQLEPVLGLPRVGDVLGVATAGTELALLVAECDGGEGEGFADLFLS